MNYIANGNVFVNEINKADGTQYQGILGGGTLFAFCGMYLYSDSCVYVSPKGTDWDQWFKEWETRNEVSHDGLIPFNNKTTIARLTYLPDGQWHEYFDYGPTSEQKEILKKQQREMIEKQLGKGAKGLYICNKLNDVSYWDYFARLKNKYNFNSMLELDTADCIANNLDELINKVLPYIDIYSLNKPESFTLFGVSSEEDAINEILKIAKPCYYRVGKKGAYMISNGDAVFCPSINPFPKLDETDPTGCGNCSTGAALFAFAEGYSNARIAAYASVAAGYNVMQYGPYPDFSYNTRRDAKKLAEKISKEIESVK